MLFAQYPLITRHYFVLCFVVCLGTLQWVAARNHRPELSLLGRWGLGRIGILTGVLLVAGGFGWFFVVTPGLLSPGLAGGELSTLFVAGSGCALFVTRTTAYLWQRGPGILVKFLTNS
jgi:hypothetical protein